MRSGRAIRIPAGRPLFATTVVSGFIDWIDTAPFELNAGRNWPDRLYEPKRFNLAASPILAAL